MPPVVQLLLSVDDSVLQFDFLLRSKVLINHVFQVRAAAAPLDPPIMADWQQQGGEAVSLPPPSAVGRPAP